MSYIPSMEWEVEFTDEFSNWWDGLSEAEQVDVNAKVILLQKIDPSLPRPRADLIHSSRHPNMKELRIQHSGRPYRVLFAFDPRRCAILLIGGDKTGNDRWYDVFVPMADALYDKHIETIKSEEK
jgi:hypothetical protein